MDIHDQHQDGQLRIMLVGRFDAHETAAFRAHADAVLAQQPGLTLRIDLSQVIFVDSSALAELLRTMRSARFAGGELVLVDPSDPLRVILEMTALDTTFVIESTAPAAAP